MIAAQLLHDIVLFIVPQIQKNTTVFCAAGSNKCKTPEEALPGQSSMHFHDADITHGIVGLVQNNVCDHSHIRLLQSALRSGNSHGDALIGHVGNAVGVALGNDQTFDLGLREGSLNDLLQLQGGFLGLALLAVGHGFL